jgi:hypothetical protein
VTDLSAPELKSKYLAEIDIYRDLHPDEIELADADVVMLGRGRITVLSPLGLKEAAEAPGG